MQLAISANQEAPRPGRFFFAVALGFVGAMATSFAWITPNHYPPWTSFHGEAAAFAGLIFLCAARLAMAAPITPGRIHWLVLGVMALILAQFAAGQIPYRGDALLSAFFVVAAGLAWWLGRQSRRIAVDIDPVDLLCRLVVSAAAVATLIAVLQWHRMETTIGIFAAERGPLMRAYSNIGQPNHFGTLVTLASALTALAYAKGRLKAWHAIALCAWFTVGLTLSESRTGLLSAFAVGLFLVWKRRSLEPLPVRRAVLGWWLLIVLFALAWPAVNEALFLQPPRAESLGDSNARGVMWRQAWAGILHSPWIGHGWRQSMVGQKWGALVVPGWLATDYSHNIALDVLLWVGLPLGVLLIGGACWWIARFMSRVRDRKDCLLIAGTLPIVVHSAFEFPFAYAYFLLPLAWCWGFVHAGSPIVGPPTNPRSRALATAVLLAFTAFAAVTAREYLQAEEDYRVMRFELRKVGRTPADYQRPNLVVLTQLGEMLAAGRIVPRPGMPPAEIKRLEVGRSQFGWATLHLAYALSLGMNGDPLGAERELRWLRDIYGRESYATARMLFLGMVREHPELAAVQLP